MTATVLTMLSKAKAGTGQPVWFPGGLASFAANATWGGGSVKLQARLPNGSTYADLPSVALTADGFCNFEFGECWLQAVATTATVVDATVTTIR